MVRAIKSATGNSRRRRSLCCYSVQRTFDLNLVSPNSSMITLVWSGYNKTDAKSVENGSSRGLELEFLGTSSSRSTLTRNVSSIALKLGKIILDSP